MPSLASVPLSPAIDRPQLVQDRQLLSARMGKPQRHRLLHGYPLAAALTPRSANDIDVTYDKQTQRGLLVGVLPHPFCNPTLTGCGFCTFPHETYNSAHATQIVECVGDEIEARVARQPSLHGRAVAGLYFGGGTANLTPATAFRKLCRHLAAAFDLSGAEVTLEGVPAYFVERKPLLIDILREEIGARHFRLSMGVQTFDEARLRQMGRTAFGNPATFAKVVEMAHARGFTSSADLLINLPGQSLADMRRDVERAVGIGLDHLGLYHLVLFRGLGTAWSRNSEMLAQLPTNEQAATHWTQLRQLLFERGFVQTTLTNFEQARHRGTGNSFTYEDMSFQPSRYDMLGFGPGAISFAANPTFSAGLKTANAESASAYRAAVRGGESPTSSYFDYDATDLRIFYLTRRLAALRIDRRDYGNLFQTDPLSDFAHEFAVLKEEGLIETTETAIRPTPRGMFYADAIASQWAWRKILARRGVRRPLELATDLTPDQHDSFDDNGYGHM